jgi:DNA invertase Pin-like site-specific DNA recombinase
VTAVQELHERGVAFVSLKEGLDLSTAAGRLQLHILSALGEFERARLIERTKAGLARARRQGVRLRRRPVRLAQAQLASVAHLPVRDAALALGVSVNTYRKARRALCQQTLRRSPQIWRKSRWRDGCDRRSAIGRLLTRPAADRRTADSSPFPESADGIDATTPAGKRQMNIHGAIFEFERERIREHVCAGLQRPRTQGTRLGQTSSPRRA